MKTYSFTLRPKTVEAADRVAQVMGFESRSALMEFALKQFVMEVIRDGKVQSRAFE